MVWAGKRGDASQLDRTSPACQLGIFKHNVVRSTTSEWQPVSNDHLGARCYAFALLIVNCLPWRGWVAGLHGGSECYVSGPGSVVGVREVDQTNVSAKPGSA